MCKSSFKNIYFDNYFDTTYLIKMYHLDFKIQLWLPAWHQLLARDPSHLPLAAQDALIFGHPPPPPGNSQG